MVARSHGQRFFEADGPRGEGPGEDGGREGPVGHSSTKKVDAGETEHLRGVLRRQNKGRARHNVAHQSK